MVDIDPFDMCLGCAAAAERNNCAANTLRNRLGLQRGHISLTARVSNGRRNALTRPGNRDARTASHSARGISAPLSILAEIVAARPGSHSGALLTCTCDVDHYRHPPHEASGRALRADGGLGPTITPQTGPRRDEDLKRLGAIGAPRTERPALGGARAERCAMIDRTAP